MLRRSAPIIGCAVLFAAPAVSEAADTSASGAEAVYRQAVDDMEAGRTDAAIERLEALVAREPRNLGAQLDLAIAQCLAGHADEAARLFLLLDSRPDLPAAIAEVIGYYRGGACVPKKRPWQAFFATGAGWAHNLNFAPMSDRVYLSGIGVELGLAPTSLSRDAPFAMLEAGGVGALSSDQKVVVTGYGQAVRYRESADYALSTAQLGLGWRDYRPDTRVDAQGTYASLRIGSAGRLNATMLSASQLWLAGGPWWLGGAANIARVDYADQPALDSRQYEARARFRWSGNAVRVTGDAGWLEDREASGRPGGNRRGAVSQLQLFWLISNERSLDATLRYGTLHDQAAYSTALFGDTRREPRLTTLNAAFRQSIVPGINLRLEYRYQSSRDTIALFDYRAYSVWSSIEWVFDSTSTPR